jgi:hypothetical protein
MVPIPINATFIAILLICSIRLTRPARASIRPLGGAQPKALRAAASSVNAQLVIRSGVYFDKLNCTWIFMDGQAIAPKGFNVVCRLTIRA